MRLLAALGLACALAPALTGAAPQTVAPERPSGGFEVDLSVHRVTVDDRGIEYGMQDAPVRFTLKRTRTASGWRVTMSADDTPVGPARAAGPVSPFAGGRIEVDDDGSAPRLYNARGDRVFADLPIPGFPAVAAMTLTDGLVADASATAAARRRRALERAFGSAAVRSPQLQRFVHVDDDRVDELTADAVTALPREAVSRRHGQVESRTTVEYRKQPDGSLLRHLMISETPVPGRQGHKVVTRTTVTRLQRSEGW